MTFLVLGGTGKTGRRVAARLREQGLPVRPAARSTPTRFDWSDDSTWEPALDGVRAAYVVQAEEGETPRLTAFAKLAAARGVERLVLLSARDWAVSGGAEALGGERAVQDSGTGWIVLRPTWFQENFAEADWVRDPVLRGELVLAAGDGLEPFVSAEDIAAVAVAALTDDRHAGQVYELSGPRLLSWGEAVGTIVAATGRKIVYRPVSPAEYRADAAAHGLPDEMAAVLETLAGWIAAGRNAHLSDGVRRALGREPRDFADYVTATAPTGVWDV